MINDRSDKGRYKRTLTYGPLIKKNNKNNKSEIVSKKKYENIITNLNLKKSGLSELMENKFKSKQINIQSVKSDSIQINNLSSKRFFDDYEESVMLGPRYVCVCCGLLEFKDSVEPFFENATKTQNELKTQAFFLKRKFFDNDDNNNWICKVCSRQLNENKLPKIALINSLEFPVINETIKDLSELEERLCSPRVAFLKIRQLNYDYENGNFKIVKMIYLCLLKK